MRSFVLSSFLVLGCLHQVLPVSAHTSSDSTGADCGKAKRLCQVVPQLCQENKKIKEAYSLAAKTEGSKYEYEKIMAAY
ncbi:hypothetical protein [Rufibacter sp. XAAS-G3-1]|uniref:hypothetical protein n=1 Tax=Rufibacter sp. XAAS-G3-1 TaxID=2729134 RepID=UPI0015E7B1C7|nr:hypothetical protein [Rufibacter sp. XAAS-G3-1]